MGTEIQHVFLVGAKSLGTYGGYETFINKLTEYHQNNGRIQYHIACKANGDGCMDETKMKGVKQLSDTEFIYHNAVCFKITVPEKLGPVQAVYYDAAALNQCCKIIKENRISNPVIYILACRIGPFVGYFYRKIQQLGGKVYLNPDGHEWMRKKWPMIIRKYWKLSEGLMVKYADLIICDSKNIEKYIHENYRKYNPTTTFIAYGAETRKSILSDNSSEFVNWYKDNGLSKKMYYLIVGRFVPENNFETIIREFMKSNSKRDLCIISTANDTFMRKLEKELHFEKDHRIKFVGTVYDQELLMKIRENAYGYFHGHEVGGTNPSLLEALSSTDLNLPIAVSFNKEVCEDAAIYWSKQDGDLAEIINKADKMSEEEIRQLGRKANRRIKEAYSWEHIAQLYEDVFQRKS